MESLPTELLLKQLLKLPFEDITKVCGTNKRINSICKQNKDYIFTQLIIRDLGYESIEETFHMLKCIDRHYGNFIAEIKFPKSIFPIKFPKVHPNRKRFEMFNKIMALSENKRDNTVNLGFSSIEELYYVLIGFQGTFIEALNALIERGKNVNALPTLVSRDKRVLFMALNYLDRTVPVKIILAMLEQKLDINAQDVIGNTALMIALSKIKETVGDDPSSTVNFNAELETVIHKILDMKPDINLQNKDGDDALSYALDYNASDTVILKILDLNPNIHRKDDRGDTVLMHVFYRSETIVKKMIEQGADVNIQGMMKDTVLMHALKKGNVSESILLLLITPNTNIDLVNMYGHTALVHALDPDVPESVVLKILDLKPNINMYVDNRYSIITYALQLRHISDQIILKMLELPIKNINTPLLYALKHKRSKPILLKLLELKKEQILSGEYIEEDDPGVENLDDTDTESTDTESSGSDGSVGFEEQPEYVEEAEVPLDTEGTDTVGFEEQPEYFEEAEVPLDTESSGSESST